MFKKFIIFIFRLKDIQSLVESERERQRNHDEKYWKSELKLQEEHLERKFKLELLDVQLELRRSQDQIEIYKNKEKELVQKEYDTKKYAKENAYIAQNIHFKMEEFGKQIMKIVGEMGGVKDIANNHKNKIESS